ncbi:MAG TPA: hypothetical protein DCG85_07905 [Lachnospiraceae bacterium]|nr:hypothetical protein [Lachnospiraceae bacterium]
MILNYISVLLFIPVVWTIGLALLKFSEINEDDIMNSLIGFPIGLSVCAVLAALVYIHFGAGIWFVRVGYAAGFVIALVYLIKKGVDKKVFYSLLMMVFVTLIVSVPGVIEGQKLFVHKGNIYDHYFYLAEVIYMCQHPVSFGADIISRGEALSDVMSFGYQVLELDRPTTPLLCASLCGKGWGNVFFEAYLFKLTVWTSWIGSMMYAIRSIAIYRKKELKYGMLFILSAIFVFGFYGQITNDIDSWPQLTSTPCLLAYVCVFIGIINVIRKEGRFRLSQFLLLVIAGSGIFLIYPEDTIVHAGLMVVATVLILLFDRQKMTFKSVLILLTVPLLIAGLIAVTDWSTLKFAVSQALSSGDDMRQNWAVYFDSYWDGYYPFIPSQIAWKNTVKKIIVSIISMSGMFIIAPDYACQNRVIMFLWIILAIIICVGIISVLVVSAGRVVYSCIKKKVSQETTFLCLAICGVIIFLAMLISKKPWSAGKMLLYISPFLYLMIVDTLVWAVADKRRFVRVMTFVPVVFIVVQFAFLAMRIQTVISNDNGTGYPRNYPSDQNPGLKEQYSYDFDAKEYKDSDGVCVNVEDPWYQSYIEMALDYEGISYYSVPDIAFYNNVERESTRLVDEADAIIVP